MWWWWYYTAKMAVVDRKCCADCKKFFPIRNNIGVDGEVLEIPGSCTDMFGPDGLIDGNKTAKENGMKILPPEFPDCYKPKVSVT